MKIKIFALIMIVIMLFAGCGSNPGNVNPSPTGSGTSSPDNSETKPAAEGKSKYYFDYNGTAIYMNADAKPILDALGEPMEFFESPSCAIQGMDRTYSYNGFDLYTREDENDENEYIVSVVFMSDGVETKEGITIGNKLEDVISKYGDNYTKEGERYTYTDTNTNLYFVFENSEVVEVSYNLIEN